MKLYGYQERVLEAIKNDPNHSQLISMPTGTGKTITFLHAIKQADKTCLILVHREELLLQTLEKAVLVGFKREDISLITGKEKEEIKKLTIAMVQTLARNLNQYKPESIEMMVIDEAHHATAASYRNILIHFRIYEDKKLLLGFTATPLRGDKDCLGTIFLSHSFKMTLSEATKSGYIVPVHGTRIEIDKGFKEIENISGDYDLKILDKLMNCPEINKVIVDRCAHLNRVPAIIFCTSVNHAQELSKLLRLRNRKAISISYLTSKRSLSTIFRMLREGRIEFITNAVKLSEGFDHPPIQSVILARPTRSPVLYKQMIGRGLRKSKDKFECFVMEFTSNDPKMMKWEDIDENCTYQFCSHAEKKNMDEALSFYKAKFRTPLIQILDIRESPFKFYECKIRRMDKASKSSRYIPFSDGFCIFEFVPTGYIKHCKDGGANMYASMWFWDKFGESARIWSASFMYYTSDGRTIQELERMALWFANLQSAPFGLSKWYPSEEEPPTPKQKLLMNKYKLEIPISSRKSEMLIEDYCIRQFAYIIREHPKLDIENNPKIITLPAARK
jgi:superfamily II DNA or RNA helicase